MTNNTYPGTYKPGKRTMWERHILKLPTILTDYKEQLRKHASRYKASRKNSKKRWDQAFKKKHGEFYGSIRQRMEPEKYHARQAVRVALRNHSLIKQPCEKCHKIKVHAHHDDYSKPLDVRWLCIKHHSEHHRLAKLDTMPLNVSKLEPGDIHS